jgi:hypothetical protein
MKCALCDSNILGHGHNAQPISNGRVCDSCNTDVIIRRIKDMDKPDTPDIDSIAEINRENWIN